MSRRAALEALRAGPALVANLPVEVVDLDRLVAHLVARGFGGGVHIAGTGVEGLLWVYDGAPREAWVFEAGGMEAVLQGEPGRDIVRQIATKGGAVSVHPGLPEHPPASGYPAGAPAPTRPAAAPTPPVREAQEAPEPAHAPIPIQEPAPEPVRSDPVVASTPPPREVVPQIPPEEDPSPLPWPAILEEVAERVARHRGPRLAARFMSAVGSALAPYGGRIANGRIIAPPLARSTWRIVVETACGPVVAIAGRAFVDRTIAAAERHITGRTKDDVT